MIFNNKKDFCQNWRYKVSSGHRRYNVGCCVPGQMFEFNHISDFMIFSFDRMIRRKAYFGQIDAVTQQEHNKKQMQTHQPPGYVTTIQATILFRTNVRRWNKIVF
jgi:hypothetical protein